MAGKSPQEQETFDQLLAKGMKVIYAEDTSNKIIEVMQKGDPVQGLTNMTNVLVKKLSASAQKSNKGIPREMVPDLALGLMSQVAELSNSAGIEIKDKEINTAFSAFIKEQTGESLRDGSRKPEELQRGIDNLKSKGQPGQSGLIDASPTERKAASMQPTKAPIRSENIPTMTERLAGGLL